MRGVKAAVSGLVVAGVLLATAGAGAVWAGPERTVDLRNGSAILIRPESPHDLLGPLAAGGDVNGDGLPDLLIGACDARYGGSSAGAVYVVYGRSEPGEIRLGESGYGFRIDGSTNAGACKPGNAGDVNGDGFDDVIVGAAGANAAFVVFGKQDRLLNVRLELIEKGLPLEVGFMIKGAHPGAITGDDVDGAGDVNGDGLADLAVSAPFIGTSYIVFGKTDDREIQLRDLHEPGRPIGYRIDTPEPQYTNTYALAGAGDVNGDGIPDLVIGVEVRPRAPGQAFVVYGKSSTDSVDVSAMRRSQGFAIESRAKGGAFGMTMDGAGDFNGDGFDDVVIGAENRPKAYLIYGRRTRPTVRIYHLGADGFRMTHPQVRSRFGFAVSGLGDVDGDGLSDVAVGAHALNFRGRVAGGGTYVVYGRRSKPPSIDPTRLPSARGFLIGGEQSRDIAGVNVTDIGDLDGDGRGEVVVGAVGAKRGAEAERGLVYIVFSRQPGDAS